jgi:hexosaminidase
LSEKGAYDAKSVYTPNDVKVVEHYAAERGISLLMEIDLPGHTGSIGESHPELLSCFDKRDWESYAVEPPSGQLKCHITFVPALEQG